VNVREQGDATRHAFECSAAILARVTNALVDVFDCVGCGAPLREAVDGTHVTCGFCGKENRIETGAAAELKARAAREDAERLLRQLGAPPSFSQRVAVGLANPWVWFLGFPFAFALLVRVSSWPMQWVSSAWERAEHERLLHVVSPPMAWVLEVGGVVVAALLLLLWSLLGQRVDARRELQAALASKPPSTPGGASLCRYCNAPLSVPRGALAANCASCGADNLLLLPASWVKRAKKTTKTLRLTAQVAKSREAEGRRRFRKSALWRMPMVAGLVLIASVPAFGRRGRAGFADMHVKPGEQVGAYKRIVHVEHGEPESKVEGLAYCGLLPGKHPVRMDESAWCGAQRCVLVMVFALNRGEALRLEWVEPSAGVEARLSLAPPDYLGGNLVLGDGFGDEVKRAAMVEGFEAPVEVSGWYKLTVQGPAEASVQPCIVGSP